MLSASEPNLNLARKSHATTLLNSVMTVASDDFSCRKRLTKLSTTGNTIDDVTVVSLHSTVVDSCSGFRTTVYEVVYETPLVTSYF